MQNQFPQQIPMMLPPNQSSAMFPNQQQSALVLTPVQGQTTTPFHQQPGQINRPVLQPDQQMLPQQPDQQMLPQQPDQQMLPQQPGQQMLHPQPFAQHQMSMPSHLRPQGPAHIVPRHSYPLSQGNAALSNSTQHSQSQNATGMPLIPHHPEQAQSSAQSAHTIPVRPGQASELQSSALEPVGRQGGIIEHQSDSASGKVNELKSEKVETS